MTRLPTKDGVRGGVEPANADYFPLAWLFTQGDVIFLGFRRSLYLEDFLALGNAVRGNQTRLVED